MTDQREGPVTEEDAGVRLDVFVARLIGESRARAAASIDAGVVVVDGEIARKSLRVEPGMHVVVGTIEPAPGEQPPEPEDIPIDVVYEDEHLLVVSKPAGLVVHPAPGNYSGTLVNALLFRAGSAPVGGPAWRPGIVHRLDAGTSGLMVVAKSDEAHERLTAMLGAREIHRTYSALVDGVPNVQTMTIEGPIGRHPKSRTKMAIVANGRDSLTRLTVLERFEDTAFLDVMPHTGRTHQIRVHLSSAGYPISGDGVYGASNAIAARLRLTRPFLHARALAFTHPITSAEIALEDPLPEDLTRALEILRGDPESPSRKP